MAEPLLDLVNICFICIMKVLLVGKSMKTGGAAIASYRLMEILRQNGMEATLLMQDAGGDNETVFSTSNTVFKRWLNFMRFVMERLLFLRHERSREVRFLFSPANTGERLHRNKHVREADLIHLHWVNAGFLSLRSIKRLLDLGKPVVWTFHDMWAMTGGCHHALDCEGYRQECGHCPYLDKPGKNDLSHRLWNKKSRLFGHRNIAVVTPSRWMHDRVRESSIFGEMETHVIHNVVDPVKFAPMKRMQACTRLGLDPGKRYILFGAASIKNLYKGFGHFQKAIQELTRDQDALEGVEVLLFGKASGDVQDHFPLKCHSFNYIDSMGTMAALFGAAHVYVISSLQDTYPTTLIESMLCGTPVVGFRTGGIPEMIDHLNDGYLAEHKSAGDLARGMRWVLSHEHPEALRTQVRNEAVRRFSGDESAAMHLELYRKLIKSQHT